MIASIPVFVGIDVACAKRKRLPICFTAFDGNRLKPLEVPHELTARLPVGRGNDQITTEDPFKSEAEAVANVLDNIAAKLAWRIVRVAIDAPAFKPMAGSRRSELSLRRCGLSSFLTPDTAGWETIRQVCQEHLQAGRPLNRLPHANKIWMLFGFEIFKALRAKGTSDVIEVYPYAIVRALLDECPHKSTPEGYRCQLEAIATETGWNCNHFESKLVRAVPGTRHDRLDAFMTAWVASLPRKSRRTYGNEKNSNDAILVPRN
jgi:predicted nuclease with RNAse H fold